jgi:hypothetical protein
MYLSHACCFGLCASACVPEYTGVDCVAYSVCVCVCLHSLVAADDRKTWFEAFLSVAFAADGASCTRFVKVGTYVSHAQLPIRGRMLGAVPPSAVVPHVASLAPLPWSVVCPSCLRWRPSKGTWGYTSSG